MKSLIKSAALFSVLLALNNAIGSQTGTFNPNHDSFVYNLTPTNNYGNNAGLASGITNGSSYNEWRTFLKFDLSAIPDDQTIQSAILHMNQVNGAGYNNSGTKVSHVSDNTWLQMQINWNNQPQIGNVLGTCSDNKGHRGWSQWNLLETGQWAWADDLNDDILSLAVEESGGSSTHNWTSINDSSNPELHPYLEIVYVPEPLSFALFALSGICIKTQNRKLIKKS